MNTAKVIDQLRKVSDERFVAAGKFVPRGAVTSGLEVPQLVYVGVTESEVVLMKGTTKMMVAPSSCEVLTRWPRSEVKVIPKGGLADMVAEFHVPDADRPIGLAYRRLDSSAKSVVRLLSAHNHAHDRLSPVDDV